MLPAQACSPLRWVLRPCFRVSAQHCASVNTHVCGHKLDIQKSAPAAVLPSLSSKSCSLAKTTLSVSDLEILSPHSSRSFSTSSSMHDVAEQKAEDAEMKALRFENGEKVQAILGASYAELMAMAEEVESAFLACVMLQRLCTLHKEGKTLAEDGEAMLQGSQLNRISKLIDENISRLSPKAILSTLQELYKVSTADVYIVKSLATQILWVMRRLPIPVLLQALQLHLRHQESGLRERVVQEALTVLERRWVELTNPKDIIFLMYVTKGSSPVSQSLMERLEDRALDMVEKASPKELYRIIYLLSRQKHRNTPLIRAVVYHLNKASVSSLSAIQLTNLVYALCILNVFDAPILSKIGAELHGKQADLTPKLASSLTTSFSRLRWKEDGMLEMLMNVLEGKAASTPDLDTVNSGGVVRESLEESLDASAKAGLVLSLANLNVDTARCGGLVERIVGLGEVQALKDSSPLLWLDVVWSMSMLKMADAASVASVLTEDFWGKLPDSDSFQSIVNMIKVSNINAVATYELEGYAGPLLPPTIPTADAKLLQKGERKAAEKVVAALTNMAPQDSYSLINTTASGGYLIDAEFYVDSNGNPKPMSQIADNSKDHRRVALKVLDFPDLTLPTSDLTGLHAMAERHLHCQGYTVVHVKHSEVPAKGKVVEVVSFLQQKVKDTLKSSVDSQANNSDSFQSIVNMIKVSNINAVATYELEGYAGPLLPPTIPTADAKLLQKGERKAAEKVVAALTNMAPQDSYSLINTTASGGYLIDAEFYVDSNGNPKPMSQIADNSKDHRRVALKVLDFPDLTLPTSDLTGLHAMAERHLHCQGYTVVHVKHSEVPAKGKVVEVVSFLQQKVKDTLKSSVDSQANS